MDFTKVSQLFDEFGVEEVGLYKSIGEDSKGKETVRYAGSDKDNKIMLITKKTDDSFGTENDWIKLVKSDEIYCYRAPEDAQPVSRHEAQIYYVTNKSKMREADILVRFDKKK